EVRSSWVRGSGSITLSPLHPPRPIARADAPARRTTAPTETSLVIDVRIASCLSSWMPRGRWGGCPVARHTRGRSGRRSRAERPRAPLVLSPYDYTELSPREGLGESQTLHSRGLPPRA